MAEPFLYVKFSFFITSDIEDAAYNVSGKIPKAGSTFPTRIPTTVFDEGFDFETIYLYIIGKFNQGATYVKLTSAIYPDEYIKFTSLPTALTKGSISVNSYANFDIRLYINNNYTVLTNIRDARWLSITPVTYVSGKFITTCAGDYYDTVTNKIIFASTFTAQIGNPVAYGYHNVNVDTSLKTLTPSEYSGNNFIFTYLLLRSSKIITSDCYNITIYPHVHGTAQSDKAEAEEGETVLITTTPDSGYRLFFGTNGTKIVDANQNEITPTLLTPTAFQFKMPDADVTVSVAFQSENPYTPGGESSGTTGPQGEFDNTSDVIPVPATPDINYSDSGLVRLFSPSAAQVISFGNYLWTGLLDFNNIIKAFANPMDSLISFHKVPIAVETDPAISVKFAGLSTTVIMPPVTKQLYDLDFGAIQFPTYYGSAFDYSPYSKAKIYLPYVGEIPLNIDRLIGKSIRVQYKVDCYSGTFVAYVSIDGQVYIQQSGSCLLSIPVSMNNYQQLITGGFNLLAGSVSSLPQIGAGFGSTASQAADLALSAVKPASDLIQSAFGKPETASSAMGGGIAGYLGVQYPYITISRPKQNLASSFNNMYGYPLNVTGYLQNYTGFVKVADITLHDTTATLLERDEIYRLLHSGVVIYDNTPPTYSDTSQNIKLAFEKYTGRQNGVCKAITTVLETTGTFRDYQDIVTPTIRVYGDLADVLNDSNMICIPRLNRRYFIDKITTNTSNSYELSLRCDVLESFWDDFKGSLAIIERAEKSFNLELNDNLFVAEQRPLFQMLKFPNGFTTTSYILALSGNNGTGD